jgi:hypothetical protein
MICAAPRLQSATTIALPQVRRSGIGSATFARSPAAITASVPALTAPSVPRLGTSMSVTPHAME